LHVLDAAGRAAVVIEHIQFQPKPGSQLNGSTPVNHSPQLKPVNGETNGVSNTANGNGYHKSSPNDFMAKSEEKATNGVNGHKPAIDYPEKPIHVYSEMNGNGYSKPTNISVEKAVPPTKTETPPKNESSSSGSGGGGGAGFPQILSIIAGEIGVEEESLTDDVVLEDLGVDSIIQISLVSSIQECLNDTLPAGFLVENNSVAKLRKYFATRFSPRSDTLTNDSGGFFVAPVH